jgi:hypothetical protein
MITTYPLMFAYEGGKKTLKVLTYDGKIPFLKVNANIKQEVSHMLASDLGITDFNWGFQTKSFSDRNVFPELYYVFFIPENFELKSPRYAWTDILSLDEQDQQLLEEVKDHV